MHPESLAEMARILDRWPIGPANVLDVGSYDVNGTYRGMVEVRGWKYTGLDLRSGPNVDVVSSDPVHFPFEDGAFDIVISGSTLEHVEKPWLLVPELARLLRPGGLLAIITHWTYGYHPYPRDTFRYMPDGMEVLFDLAGCLRDYDIFCFNGTDIRGVAYKAG